MAPAMWLRVCASRPISLRLCTVLRCSNRPWLNSLASAPNWRSGQVSARLTQVDSSSPSATTTSPMARLLRRLARDAASAVSTGTLT